MEWSEALTQNLFGFVSALIGGLAGGYFTLYATNKAIREQYRHEELAEEKQIQNLLDALSVEIDTLWSFHLRRVGGMVEELKDGDALEFYYPLTQDYFTIYNTNADHIGAIKDRTLRQSIVICYNKCKKVVDGFKYNNELYREYTAVASQANTSNTDYIRERYKALQDYAQIIREDHFELKGYVEGMLALLAARKG